MKHILILGGGFGGVYTAYRLLKKLKEDEAQVTLVSDKNYFLFAPMLHEVATGNIRIHNVVEPIREIVVGENFHFCKTRVKEIDLKKKTVKTGEGDIKYDYLVVALGSETNFYDTPGSNYCYTLKSLQDAYDLRNHVIDMFEHASMIKDDKEKEKLLCFVVVGGGPTGVELACELGDWIFGNFKRDYHVDLDCSKIKICLINLGKKVLQGTHEKNRDFAMKILKKKGVDVITGAKCYEVGKEHVAYRVGKKEIKLKSKTVIWTAGIKPKDIKIKGIEKERGTLPVSPGLKVKGYDNVYALGDIAGYVNPKDESRPPPTAQLAHKQSKGVADNIVANIRGKEEKPFVFVSNGFLASLGNKQAIADIGGIRFHGFFAWWLWRTIYLSKLIGFQNKLRVVIDWTFDLFFTRDTSQV